MKIKVKIMSMVLLLGVLCAGTITVLADSQGCSLDDCKVTAEAYASSTTYSGMVRTVSNSYDVYTGVTGYYHYYDSISGNGGILYESDSGSYGSEVTFSLPTGYNRAYSISGDHVAQYAGQSWTCTTKEYFD